jgi:hypothetical protein
MKLLRKLVLILALLALIAAAVWFYFTPQLAFREIRVAVRDRNLGQLESRVDFPVLRAHLKDSLQSRLAQKLSGGSNPFGRVGAALAGTVVDPLIDQLVTPETLALLMRGDRSGLEGGRRNPSAPAPAASGPDTGPTDSSPNTDKDELEKKKDYEAFNRYVISVKKKGTPGEPIAFVLTRQGLLDWKLTEIRNPF